jgi:hypothetical protein
MTTSTAYRTTEDARIGGVTATVRTRDAARKRAPYRSRQQEGGHNEQ